MQLAPLKYGTTPLTVQIALSVSFTNPSEIAFTLESREFKLGRMLYILIPPLDMFDFLMDVAKAFAPFLDATVGRFTLTASKPELKARLVSAIETKCDEPRSNFAFNFNLRRYTTVSWEYLYVAFNPMAFPVGPDG
jgi:hypothetical protein